MNAKSICLVTNDNDANALQMLTMALTDFAPRAHTIDLNDQMSDPTHRIFADTDPANEKLYAWIHFNMPAKRKIPFYSTPQLSGMGT